MKGHFETFQKVTTFNLATILLFERIDGTKLAIKLIVNNLCTLTKHHQILFNLMSKTFFYRYDIIINMSIKYV